ncbi:hypothetical protein HBH84_083340 [Parastagonospora nodorum]|nr:hypothetical protein HBH84_083340 [Parastagonospora nodorum]
MICSFQPKTYAGLAKYIARYRKVHVYAADGLSSTITVYNYIEKDKNADLVIANSISDALDMCAKDDLKVLFQTYNRRLAGELAIAESVTVKELLMARGNVSNANILLLIAFIISYCLFADELNIQQSLLDRAIVVLIIILVDKTQLLLILGDVAAYTLLARFIPTTKIRDLLLKKNAAKSEILLACADGRIRQCYLTICAILRCLDKGHDDFVHLVNCFGWKHYNFNIHVSLATDTLHLLLKGLTGIEQKAIIQQLIAVVSLLFVLKAPFALHFIHAVCDLVILAQYKNIRMYRALDSICTRANSEAHYITIVKQFYSMTNKKDCISVQIHPSIKCWRFSSKRHNDPKHCDKEVLYLILTIIDYTCYDKDGKYIAYIRAFSEVLLFNNNRQIDNTTRILTFKFYDLSTIICLVHLVLRDLPNLITYTTMSYYVNNYINWDEYNCLYLLTFDIDLLRTLREY